jgi:stress-induced-phosphoprotein 1
MASRSLQSAEAAISKAWELFKSIVYLNNRSAAEMEKGDLDAAIETAQKAVDEGREIRADYKDVAKWVSPSRSWSWSLA